VEVDDAVDGFGPVLEVHPVAECSEEVPEVDRTGRLDAGEDS
jgi:hypothetical protein